MTITLFILNVIWALLGIAIFIYSFIAIRDQRRKTRFESLMLHFRYIEHLTKMRDIFRSYGMNQAADNLDNDIKKTHKRPEDMKLPILMTEEHWRNDIFSVARIYGGMTWNGQQYLIVNKEGATIMELSNPHSRYYVGDCAEYAIPPSEPADMVMKEWVPIYKALGREKMLEMAEKGTPLVEALKIMKDLKTRTLRPKKRLVL